MSRPNPVSRTTPDSAVARLRSKRQPAPLAESALRSKPAPTGKEWIPSVSFSLGIHACILLILSWIYFDLPNNRLLDSILSLVIADKAPLSDQIEFDVQSAAEPTDEIGEVIPLSMVTDEDLNPPASMNDGPTPIPDLNRVRTPKVDVTPPPKAAAVKPAKSSKGTAKKGLPNDAEGLHADHFVGRSSKAKAALLKRMGGTDASEAAVARGLIWLKNHQLPDGSWNFDHLLHPLCDCTMPGRLDNNPNAATAMALMAFLGAGQTHEEGDYQTEVKQGLDFLIANGMRVEKGICFYGGLSGSQTYYTHGLVLIALSEASAMTGDPVLRPAITGAVEFLVATQEQGGGWRYFPGQPGDTSVVAWELMGLKSAQFCRIAVPQRVFTGIDRFIGSVSSHRGVYYAYTPDRKAFPTPSMTAAGLLCRMYLDFDDNKGKLSAGIRFLDEHGPEPEGMYYNYYATQVMHHWGGPEWDRWNNVMREFLIRTQVLEGHATGSWDVADRHGYAGGRLYMTSLALLTLEVYYRHLPLYQKDRIEVPLINAPAELKKP